jgi:hypothetical protein
MYHFLIKSFSFTISFDFCRDLEEKFLVALLPNFYGSWFEHIKLNKQSHHQVQLLAELFNSDMKTETSCYNDEELISTPTPSRSHYSGHSQVAALFFHDRSVPSPSSFSKILVDTKSSAHDKKDSLSFESTSTTKETIEEAASPLAMNSIGPNWPTHAGPSLDNQAQRGSPSTSFAERDSNQSNPKPLSHLAFATVVTLGSSSGQQRSAGPSSSKRASVGLPSLYPGYHRGCTLAETVLEELQDFEELFEQPCIALSAMNASNALGEDSYKGNRLPSPHLPSPMKVGLLDDDDLSWVASPSEEQEKAPSSPPRRGRRSRSRNQAMDQDFFNRVMNEIHL